MWKGLKDCLLETSEEECGRTKGLTKHRETWWWNQEVAKVVEEKRSRFKTWNRTRTEEDRALYCKARRIASREIFKAQELERKTFGAQLDEENMKGHLFRIAKQMVKKNKDVVGAGCVKERDGILLLVTQE